MPCLPIVFFSSSNSWPVSPEENSSNLHWESWSRKKQSANYFFAALLTWTVQYSMQPVLQQDLGIKIWSIFPASESLWFFCSSYMAQFYSFNGTKASLAQQLNATEISGCIEWAALSIILSHVKMKLNYIWEFDHLVCLHWIRPTKIL